MIHARRGCCYVQGMVRRSTLFLAGLALVAAVAVAGCGGSSEKTFDVEAGCRKALDSLQTK